MSDLECPYCEAELEVCHDDGFGYDEDEVHEMQCSECDKNFVFNTHISYNYFSEKADCLNGSPHRFNEWRRLWLNQYDEEVQYRRCKDCDEEERRTIKKEKP